MTTIGKNKLYAKMQQLDEYLDYLEKVKKEVDSEKQFISDFHFFGLAERYLQLAIQTVIDSVQIIITEEGLARPADNQEAISVICNQEIISQKLAAKMDGIVGFRNILVHEYGKIDHKKIYNYLQNEIKILQEFKKEVVKYLN